MTQNLTVIVLAAGGGTRMKSKTMKVLHPVAGRSMIGHVLHAVRAMEPQLVVAVVGNQREQVGPHIRDVMPEAVLAVQDNQEGTAHAVAMALQAVTVESGTIVVVTGDTPLLQGESLKAFVADHEASMRAVSILSGHVVNPSGYGRILRNTEGDVEGIVEEKDATDQQRQITEINSGILAFDAEFLRTALPQVNNDNSKGEYYLTDTVQLARDAGLAVGAWAIDDVMQTEGANDRVQLAELGRELNRRIVTEWMKNGVTVMDPATTWIEADVRLAEDVTLLPGTQLLGATTVAQDAVIGPDTTLKDCEVGEGARVVRTHGELAVIGAGATVGPFAYLRPGTELGARGKIGTFVETKNAKIGDGAKVPHLSYIGDAEIGEGSNIGAGSITANYDGVKKHRTVIGKQVRSGSDNVFVAPVSIGDGASTGAGTVVRRDVPPGALAVSSGPQRNFDDWAQSRRPGTPQAEAAGRAVVDALASQDDGASVSEE